MTILVDIDSTITNFAETLLLANNQLHGTFYKYSDIKSYDWFDSMFKNPWNPTNYQSFWNSVKVDEKAISTIESWVNQGHQVYLVTASHFNDMLGYKIKKTLENFNQNIINNHNIIISQNKSIIMGDVMIDDYIVNLNDFNRMNDYNKVCICFSQPWNETYQGHFRYNNWDKIDSVIQVYNLYPWNK